MKNGQLLIRIVLYCACVVLIFETLLFVQFYQLKLKMLLHILIQN